MRHSLSTAFLALVIDHASLPATAQVAPDVFAPARQHLLRSEYAAASASYQQVLRQQTGTARDYYQAAQAAARNQEQKRALDWLAQAITKGYYSEAQLRAEEDFVSLTSQSVWPRLLTRARSKQQQHEAPLNQALVTLLKKIQYQDQHYRLEAEVAERKYGLNAPQFAEAMRQQSQVDGKLIRQVDSLINRWWSKSW